MLKSIKGKINIKRIVTDYELDTMIIKKYRLNNSVKFEFTIPGRSSGNGVSEVKNRTVIERTETILSAAGLSKRYWEFSVRNFLHNLKNTKS